MDFDFNDFTPAAAPVWFHLTNPNTGADLYSGGKPVRVAILGPDTPAMDACEKAIQNRRLTQMGRTGRIKMTAEEIDVEAAERCATALAGWENFVAGGAEVPYSPAAAKDLLSRFPWLRSFVEQKYADAGNFLGTAEPLPKK